MTRDDFWMLIENANADEAALERALAVLEPYEIESFQSHFYELFAEAYRWDLWGAAYIMEGGCSDDGFTDFRYGLIALGRKRFEKALRKPDSLVEVDDMISNESFGYAARRAYQRSAGREMPCSAAISHPADPDGNQWDFDDEDANRRRLPGLTDKYFRR
jgi:hypothetical protein